MGLSCSRLNTKTENWKLSTVAAANILGKLGKSNLAFFNCRGTTIWICIILLSQFFKKPISKEVKNTPKEYQYEIWLSKTAKSYSCDYGANFINPNSLPFKHISKYHLGQKQLQAQSLMPIGSHFLFLLVLLTPFFFLSVFKHVKVKQCFGKSKIILYGKYSLFFISICPLPPGEFSLFYIYFVTIGILVPKEMV